MQGQKRQFNFKKDQINYSFSFQKGTINIFVQNNETQSAHQGDYSNDNLPEIFLHLFETAQDLFMSLQTTERSSFNLEDNSLTIQIAFMNKKKKFSLPLQKIQQSKEKLQDRKIKKLQQKVNFLQGQVKSKDLIISEQQNQLNNLRFIVQNMQQQIQKQNWQKDEKAQKLNEPKKLNKFTVNPNCKFSNKYLIFGNLMKKTVQGGSYYQLWGNKLSQNEVFTLQIKLKNVKDNSIGFGIESSNMFDKRWLDCQTQIIQFYGHTHTVRNLGVQKQVKKYEKKVVNDDLLKMVVENKKKISFYINDACIYQRVIEKNFSAMDLYPFVELMGLNDEIEID